jgi:biopolymer transport protein ExbD
MAASVKSGGDEGDDLVTDINITPLVDVVLVLLIVFMITVPAVVAQSMASIKVDLPSTSTSAKFEVTADILPLKIYVSKEAGEVVMYVNEKKTSESQLAAMIKQTYIKKKDDPVQIFGAKSIAYGEVIKLMDTVNGLGMHKISLMTKNLKD